MDPSHRMSRCRAARAARGAARGVKRAPAWGRRRLRVLASAAA